MPLQSADCVVMKSGPNGTNRASSETFSAGDLPVLFSSKSTVILYRFSFSFQTQSPLTPTTETAGQGL